MSSEKPCKRCPSKNDCNKKCETYIEYKKIKIYQNKLAKGNHD